MCLPVKRELIAPRSNNVFWRAKGWIAIQRKVNGGSLSFNQNWAAYRDGFGSATDYDNYWLGLDKVYCLVQRANASLKVEV